MSKKAGGVRGDNPGTKRKMKGMELKQLRCFVAVAEELHFSRAAARLGVDQSSLGPVQDAKARFSELLEASLSEGPQIVSRRGVSTAVLISMQEWLNLRERARPGLKTLLLTSQARGELNIPPRGALRRRATKTSG